MLEGQSFDASQMACVSFGRIFRVLNSRECRLDSSQLYPNALTDYGHHVRWISGQAPLHLLRSGPLIPLVGSATTLLIFTHAVECRHAHMHAKRTHIEGHLGEWPSMHIIILYADVQPSKLQLISISCRMFEVDPSLYVAEMLIGGL